MTFDFSEIPVLVVDDEKFARVRLASILKRLKFEKIMEAPNCDEAMMAVSAMNPAVIFCDIHMKPKDGMTFVTELRYSENRLHRDIPVVLVSSDARSETQAIGRQLNSISYLVKPVSMTAVQMALEKYLGVEF